MCTRVVRRRRTAGVLQWRMIDPFRSLSLFTLFNRRAGSLLIAGAFILLAIYLARSTLPPEPEVSVKSPPSPPSVSHSSPAVFDAKAFKRTIIDNNLFRPLGWTPPVPREPYRLIGTKLARDGNTPPQAILQSTTGHTTHIVSLGDNLDADTQIVDIQPKQVTLSTNGQQRTLTLNTAIYLNRTRATRHPRQMTNTPHRQIPTSAPVRSKPTPALTKTVSAPQTPDRLPPLSDWQTHDGIPIRLGDARLKNPQKWGLRRR